MTAFELRPVQPDDEPFLERLYASTRLLELEPVPWTEDQKLAFLAQQYRAQDSAYRASYPEASFSVVTAAGRPIGRLCTSRLGSEELRIIDIALLPDHRNAGIGTALIRDVMRTADRDRLTISLHVEHWNPALALYERLGFVRAGENEVHVRMERPPS